MFKAIKHFEGARQAVLPATRVEQVREASLQFRQDMLAGEKVHFFQSIDLVKVPYPSYYGLRGAYTLQHAFPYMHILNRMFVVQFKTAAGLKTMLFSPSDVEGNRETPFFKHLSRYSPRVVEQFMAPVLNTVESALQSIGLKPEQIDFISYDHLHTQDVRRWLGTRHQAGFFPNAKLIVHQQEWDSANGLTPIQAEWYCPNGIADIPEEKIIKFSGDVMLGDGVALIHTPGHTEGNHSLVVHTDEGLWVTSENGVSVDSYMPLASSIPGLREYAKRTKSEVVLNGNTLENSIDQYISMVQEKTIAGPSLRNPNFPNIFPSSELTWFWANPLARSSHYVGQAKHGELIIK